MAAQNQALAEARGHLRAIFKALKPNEKRVMLALANLPGSPREAANAAAVGLKTGSVTATLDGLRASADLFDPFGGGPPVITDAVRAVAAAARIDWIIDVRRARRLS